MIVAQDSYAKLFTFYQRIREQYTRLQKRKEYYKAKYNELYQEKYAATTAAAAAVGDPFASFPPGVTPGERAAAGSPVEMVTANGNAVVGAEQGCDVELGGV